MLRRKVFSYSQNHCVINWTCNIDDFFGFGILVCFCGADMRREASRGSLRVYIWP